MIVAGFIGVGKTRAAKEWNNCVNIELSPLYQFQPEYLPGQQLEASKGICRYIHNPLYPYNAVLNILKEEALNKLVIINAVESVLIPLVKEYQRKCILVYPDVSLRDEYRKKYQQRGNNETFIRHIMDEWDTRLQFLKELDYGCVHLPLGSGCNYLSDTRTTLEKLCGSAQPPVSPDILCMLEQKVNTDSKSYCLTDSQKRYVLPVDLRSTALREYLCQVVMEDMPRPILTQNPPNRVVRVETLEEFMKMI